MEPIPATKDQNTFSAKPHWREEKGLEALLAQWRQRGKIRSRLVLESTQKAQEPIHAPFPEQLDAGLVQALQKRGLKNLYSHQAEAFGLAQGGHSFVVATPTASGKSLCYNLPVLSRLAQNPQSRSLYLFPTKALSRDQEEAVRALMKEAGIQHGAITYDGDTPGDARRAARRETSLLLTNPDMLHSGILPHHTAWSRFFANLDFVILDELHTYRGVFGSHLANLLRRLERIARFHGSRPQFILSSATIGNPQEHASNITDREVFLVGNHGAAQPQRTILVYNPPVVNEELGIRQSYIKASVQLTLDLLRAGITTLVFGQSRNGVEVMLKYLHDRLATLGIDRRHVVGYRGGYLPQTRRRIEEGLRQGEVLCVVATNALELGIDIGSLDAVVCAGYPGSLASLWQRFGRGGRRGNQSLALLVTSSHPIDQYFASLPEHLIGTPIEEARIDRNNVEVVVQHLKCAAFELPVQSDESFGTLGREETQEAMQFLAQNNLVHSALVENEKSAYHWMSDAYPASHVSLRNIGWDNFVIIDTAGPHNLAEMDWRSAHTMLHEQAIYQHEGEQYQVEKLDYDNRKAYVQRVAPDYYTTAMTHTSVTVIDEFESKALGLEAAGKSCTLRVGVGEVSVVDKVVGFKKIKYHTHENTGYGEVKLPEMQMHTSGVFFTFPNPWIEAQPLSRAVVLDILRGLSKALHTVAAVGLMTDPRDLGHTLGEHDPIGGNTKKVTGQPTIFDPTIFLYDRMPGGVGLASRIYTLDQELFTRAYHLIQGCDCHTGCPLCIGPQTTNDTDVSRKQLFDMVLGELRVGSIP